MAPTITLTTFLIFVVASLLHTIGTAFIAGTTPSQHHRQQGSIARHAATTDNIVHIDDSNYHRIINGDKPVLIDAYTQWCGPCKLIEPVLNRFAEKYNTEVIVAKFDVEGTNHNNLKLELLLDYGVRPTSLPSLFLLHNQEVHATHEGLIMDDELDEIIKSNIRNDKKKKADTHTDSERKSGFVNLGQQVDDYMLTDV